MPEYKKKRINRLRGAPKPKKNKSRSSEMSDDIVMSPTGKAPKSDNKKTAMRVVKGKKLEQKRRLKIFSLFIAVVVLICTVLELVLPVGIIENAQNLTSLIGAGSYPTDLSSNNTINTVSRGSYYYVLTDTLINAYSNGGKKIYSHAHGYENPVLKTSKTRALIFDQGGTSATIYNLKEEKSTITVKKDIITANISDSGTYAVVTRSDKYASAVSVYSKNNKLIYEWYSSEDMVNNIAISPNGKKIVVSTFNTKSGLFNSKISVLNYKSASAEFSETFDGTLVYEINTTYNSAFSVLTTNGFDSFSWSKYEKNHYKNDYTLLFYRTGIGGSVAVFNRESDRTDNRVVLFTAKGKLNKEFSFKGIISDIQISNGHIYCISDTEVFILDKDGSVLRQSQCGFGAVSMAVIGTNTVAVVTDNQISKIELE